MTTSEMDRPFGSMPLAQARALMASPDRFGTLNDFDLERLTYSAMCLYGSAATLDLAAKVAPLFSLYESRVRHQRLEALYKAILAEVRAGALTYHPLDLFLNCEALDLVCCAARDASGACPLEDDDPLTGPRFTLQVFRELACDVRRPFLFAGLLDLGDRRACRLLWDARDELALAELEIVAELRSRYMYASVALFWLDWLEELIDSERDRRFDLAARALSRVPWPEGDRKVIDIRRDFPVTESAHPIEVLRVWTLEDYAAIIAPRLRAIEAREPEPKLMPQVLEAWRIAPVEKAKTRKRRSAAKTLAPADQDSR